MSNDRFSLPSAAKDSVLALACSRRHFVSSCRARPGTCPLAFLASPPTIPGTGSESSTIGRLPGRMVRSPTVFSLLAEAKPVQTCQVHTPPLPLRSRRGGGSVSNSPAVLRGACRCQGWRQPSTRTGPPLGQREQTNHAGYEPRRESMSGWTNSSSL
ncbi:hypothetical protein GQ53DRAFT_333901 [Thozetella sp. PMI_491]|nr:hypothetical protein GQ53DRAFT_333901 [Thozetella sp. PMI_491]